MQNCQKNTRKTFPPNICHKWIIYLQKTWIGWLTTLKFCTQIVLVAFKKKAQNNFFVSDPIHCENGIWNILIFAKYFHHEKLFAAALFWGYCSTRPHMLIFSHCSQQLTKVHRGWIVLIIRNEKESETELKYSPKYFVWNNETAGKWGLWLDFGLNL